MAATKNIDIKILSFFDDITTPKDFARSLRRVNYILSLQSLRNNEDDAIKREWLDEGFYILNEFAETLDPVLED